VEQGQGSTLEHLIAQSRRRLAETLHIGLVAGLGILLTIVLLISTGLVRVGINDSGVGIVQIALLGAGATAALVGWMWARRTWLARESSVADLLDRRGSQLRSAMELARDRGQFGSSEGLADAAVRALTADAVARGAAPQFERELRRVQAGVVGGLAGLLVVAVLVGLWAPRSMAQALTALASIQTFDDPWERIPPEPQLSNLRVTYRYPAYVARAPRRMLSADGSVRALPGTEVTLEATTPDRLREASLELQVGDPTAAAERVAAQVSGTQLQATFVLRREGTYRVRLVTGSGEVKEQRRGRPIRLDVDEVPVVRLLAPDVSPLEVNEHDDLRLRFRAEDDYGLGEATLRWRILGRPREGEVALLDFAGERTGQRAATVSLTELELQPGDRVAYSVEVADSDIILGPKRGASRTQELRVYSQRDHHARVLEAQQKALDELVHLMGDHLEQPFELARVETSLRSARRKVERAATATVLLRDAELASREDPLGRKQVAAAFAQARKGLATRRRASDRSVRRASQSPTTATAVGRAEEKMTGWLEQNTVYLADLLNDQRMIDAEALAQRLREEQQALRDALEAYREAPSEALREQIAASIEDIKARISELMTELAKLQSTIPTDYANPDALQREQMDLDRLLEQVEDGQLDRAMEQLDQMLNQTERMLAQLQDGRSELQSREYSEISQRAEEIWRELEDVTMRQEELARRTEAVADVARERMTQQVDDADAFVQRQLARLDQALARLGEARDRAPAPDAERFDVALQRVNDGKVALEARDFGAAREVLDRATGQLSVLDREAARRIVQVERFGDFVEGAQNAEAVAERLRRARPPLEAVLEDLDALTPRPESVLDSEERQALQEFRQQQDSLRQRARGLEQQLDELGEQLPIVGEEVGETLDEVQQAMGQAAEKLGQSDAPGGLGGERRALEGLRQLQSQLQQMGEPQAGGSGQGVPLPFGFQPPRGSRGEDGQGRDVRSQERVEIPSPEAYEAPAEFREELLEAAKQGTVEQFKDAVRRYYEELVK
jgi:uncharacterized protein YukE